MGALLHTRASEQGNVIGFCSDRLLLVPAETLVTQHSPCYSAVSASLVNPSPDCSNYSPFCHTLILRKPFKIVKTTRFIQVVTPHTQRERGKMIVYIYICI